MIELPYLPIFKDYQWDLDLVISKLHIIVLKHYFTTLVVCLGSLSCRKCRKKGSIQHHWNDENISKLIYLSVEINTK